MSPTQNKNIFYQLVEFIFYSNYFYGICAVALTIEATLQQLLPLNGFFYLFLIFTATVLFYSYPYIHKNLKSTNPRTNWYTRHYNFMRWNQIIMTIILIVSLFLFLKDYGKAVLNMSLIQWVAVLMFPVVGALYYGSSKIMGKYNLRNIGWLKPFVIGFSWAGLVTVYPVMYYEIVNEVEFSITWVNALLFLKNLMFVTVLCIMFDFKDYSNDYISRLRTFVVKYGLRKTLFYILFPLSVIGLGSFVWYAVMNNFHIMRIVLNVIPFLALILVAWSLRRRRSLLYYLIVVDGIMLVKAICGTIAITYF